MQYDPTSDQYSNAKGVEIRIPGFGNTSTVEVLDPGVMFADYFKAIVSHFVSIGYTRNKDIRAAPFDWRLGPSKGLFEQVPIYDFVCIVFFTEQLEHNGYYKQFHWLIESTFSQNGNQPVVILAHSLGGLVSHYFLTKLVSQEWKDKYVAQYITVASVWAGAVKVLLGVVSGETDGLFPFMAQYQIRVAERSFPSEYWLAPRPVANAWPKDQVLLSTPLRNYTAYDLPKLMQDLDSTETTDLWSMYNGVASALSSGLPPPNVRTLCIAGTGVKTDSLYVYTDKFPNGSEHTSYSDGDGSVNINSARSCKTWIGNQKYPVKYQELNGVEHVALLSNPQVIALLEQAIMKGM